MRNCQPPDASPSVSMPAAAETDRVNLQFRIKNEFEEMPGLCVTRKQAQRLWGLDEPTCDEALAALVGEGYLRHATIGYVKA